MQTLASETTDLKSEYEIASEHAGWAALEIGVLSVTGRDRAHWLHKLITADVEHLTVGQGVRGALLDAKGHFVADLYLLVLSESILLLVEPGAKETLFNTLRRYIFREKVQLSDTSDAWSLFTLIGPESDSVLPQHAPETPYHFTASEFDGGAALFIRSRRANVPSNDVLVSAQAREQLKTQLNSVPVLAPEILEILRVEGGQPHWGDDFDATTLALEIPDVLNVRVDQGCYVGQEVVARIVHRGHVNRHLVGLKLEAEELPPRGALIRHDGQEVGSLTSVVRSPRFGAIALGYIRREVSESGTTVQVGDNISAQVVKLPFSD